MIQDGTGISQNDVYPEIPVQKLDVSSKLLDFVPNLYRSTRVSICAAKTLQPGKHLQPAVRRCIGPTANEARTANRPTFTAQG